MGLTFVDTHSHLYADEFKEDMDVGNCALRER